MYEIPKISVPIEILLTDNETIAGTMFVSDDRLSLAGHPLIEDVLNEDPEQFFPFQTRGGAYRLINKSQLIFIRTEQDDSEAREQTNLKPRNLVAHLTNDNTIYGVVYPTLPEESRVSDIINQNKRFISVFQNSQKVIVNRDQVIYVNAN